ncbi:MAG: aldehyde dehydrogenase family protein [Candidatus Sumerlaeia bacterium]|nr:aldehyde dehydrogenase family protein [Candidatus Sumerlaeia bacterium]
MSTATLQPIAGPVQKFLDKSPHKLLIGGKWVEAASGETFEAINPADESVLARVAKGGAEDVNRAVAAARKAFDSGQYRFMSCHGRSKLLNRLADAIEDHLEEFAQLDSLDNGKPLAIARAADIPLVVEHFRYYAGWADKLEGETIPVAPPYDPNGRYLNYTLREPVGVVGQIIPWNFPLLMAAWKLGAALASGCSVILKPAEQTPLSAIRLAELICDVGFPDGVFNLITGYGDAGEALVKHDDVDKVAFTGSTEVGKKIVEASSGNLKKVTLELGGKSPNVVFADADPEVAAAGAASAIFFNHGQCCCAGSRLFIQKPIYDEVLERVAEIGKNLKVGPGMAEGTEMGPLVSSEQLQRVSGYIKSGIAEGAETLVGGEGKPSGLNKGYFCKPTVFGKVRGDMKMIRDEIFGPVVAAFPFDDLEDVAAEANNTEYGLAAGIFTKDIGRAHRLAELIRAGTVWINCYNMFDAASPFGGYKQSGYGREMGKHALDNYLQTKSVWVKIG